MTLTDGLPVTGGAERLAMEIAMRLDRDRFESILCVSRWSDAQDRDPSTAARVEQLRSSGTRLIAIRRSTRAAVWAWKPVLDLLRSTPVDVLHAHKFGSNVWGALLSSAARTPVFVAHEHNWAFQGRPLRRLLDRALVARRADRVIAVSERTRERMIEVEGLPPEKVVYVPNGIPSLPPAAAGDVRTELGVSDADQVVVTACTLRPEKALDVLIDATALLRARHPRLRVLIAGDGPERAALEHRVAERRLAGSVLLLGRRTDVPAILRAGDVAVCCSDWEGSPLSVMEYMDAGLAIVATDVGGIPGLISDGVEGRLVPPRSPRALADAIGVLLDDSEQAAELGRRARDRRRQEFGIDTMVRRVEGLYAELLAASSAGAGSAPGPLDRRP